MIYYGFMMLLVFGFARQATAEERNIVALLLHLAGIYYLAMFFVKAHAAGIFG